MKDKVYLVVSQGGVHKMYKGTPSLQPGQLAFRLNIEIPDEAFDQPFQNVNLTVGKDQLIKPPISVDVGDPEDEDGDEEEEREQRR